MNVTSETLESIDVSDVVVSLGHLQLSVIPQNYVDQVMSSQYSYYKFPESYESIVMPDIDFSSVINYSCELLNTYLQQQPELPVLWDQFINDDTCVHPKPLSCLLNCYIQNAINDVDETVSRKNGLSATRLFFLASTFRGSKNIGFYHISLLAKCSELIKYCISMLNDSGGISTDDSQLDEDERNDLMADLLAVVRDTAIMVKRFVFFDETISLDYLAEVLINVTRLEKNSGNILEQVPTENLSFGKLAFIAYSVLTNMFNENCGTTFVVGQKIMNYLISGLLIDEQREMQLTTRQFNVVRDHHLSFIRKLTLKLGASFESILEILLQHLLHRGPDRSELKPRQFQIILEVWRLCPNTVRIEMKYYLFCLVYDVDAKLRAVALETLFKFLSEPEETEPEDPQLLQIMPATKHEFIVALILSKFQDSLLTVRAKAFSLFATLTSGSPTATAHQTALVKRVLVDPYLNVENLNQTSFCKKDFHDFYPYLGNRMANFNSSYISTSKIYPGAKILLWVLNVHARDERAHIRRLSLTLLCNLFLVNKKFMEKYYLSLLVNSCADCAMTIRKVAVSGLTDLILKYPDNQDVLKYWFKGLIHLVGDRDKKIQELAVECLDRVILKNIKPYSAKLVEDNNPLDYLPWRVIDNALNEKVFKYMMCLCERWRVNGLLTDRIIKDVMSYVVNASDHGWTVHSFYLLQLISHQLDISNVSPVIKYFDAHFDLWFSNEIDPAELNILLTHAQMVLDIMFLNYKRLDKKTKQRLLDTFEELLFDFKVPTRIISKSLDLYTVLQSDDSNKKDNNMKKLFQNICNFMETSTNINSEEIMIRHIFTLGDIGLIQHFKIKNKFQKYLLSFLGKTDQPVSPAFQTIVVLTIGKLSIVDERFAKEAIVQFGTILKNPCHPSIKINALTALADLCLRCTTLVEQAIPEMCVCLKAESLPVKRVALKLLTGLILEDYIKLRDVAFFALLCMLEDRDSQVRQETSSFIVNYLLIKNKDIMERKLIEVIFHFNGYTGERSSGIENCFTNPELKAFFSMEGDSKRASRHCVYRFMLTHMLDDNKLKLMVKIFNIFEEVVKDVRTTTSNEVKERATYVMKDAFWILKAKEMALTSGKPRDSNNDDDPGTLEKVADIAKKQVVMETYKMVMTDYIIPGVLKLKYELDKNKKILPTVMNDLRAYLCMLTSGKSPIKNEIVKLLSVDNDLVTEILHDNKQMKQHKQQPGGENCDESDDDDDDYDDVAAHFIEDLEYVTWAQIMDMRDQAEASGIDKSMQVLMQEELQQQVSEIIAEDNLQDEAVAKFSQLTGEAVRPIKREKKNVSTEKCKLRKKSGSNRENQLIHDHEDQSASEKNNLDETDSDDSNLPGYRLFN